VTLAVKKWFAKLLGDNSPDSSIAALPNRSGTNPKDDLETVRLERDELKILNHLAQKRIRYLEAVLHSIPEAAIVTDSSDRVILANDKAKEVFQFSLVEGSHKQLNECIHDEKFLDLLKQVQQFPSHKVAEHSRSVANEQRWYNVILSSITNVHKNGSVGVLAILHDVTREKEAARMKTDFVSSVSHELRTPLTSIKAYLEMLIDGEVQDQQTQQKFYGIIQNEATRLSKLVDNILNISRIEAGVVKVSKQNVPLAAIVKEVFEVLRPQADASGISLVDELTPVFFHVRADREMMRQVLFNLISNALKYTPQGGTVTVRLLVDEGIGQVTAEVTDTGVGVSKEDLPHLFEKFYRVSGSKNMAKGSGLGLALVKEIVETVHNGRVSVASTPNEGSTFSFTLPLVS